MAVRPRFIADKSALARIRLPQVEAVLSPLILVGAVATCSFIELEILFSARGYQDFVNTRAARSRAYPLVPMIQRHFDRAIEVMEGLARRGLHRAVGIPDLLI